MTLKRADWWWLAGYLAVVAAVVFGLFQARAAVMRTYGTREAQAEWETWRKDAADMAEGAGPVRRRPPKSIEPPALVLMRDHFGVCLAISLVLSSVLFGTTMAFVRGAFASASQGAKKME